MSLRPSLGIIRGQLYSGGNLRRFSTNVLEISIRNVLEISRDLLEVIIDFFIPIGDCYKKFCSCYSCSYTSISFL